MGIKIHQEVYGDGPREIVVCCGLSQSTANWRGIARQYPQFRWILFDTRGQGKSEVGPRPYSLDDHVDDLMKVVETNAEDKPFVMGFSHGGRVATRAARKHPEAFSGLIIVSVAARISTRRAAYFSSWEACLKLGGVEAMAWSSLTAIVGDKVLEKFDDLGILAKGTAARNTQEGLLAMFEGIKTYPAIADDAEGVRIPTLVLRGEDDPLVDARDSEIFCERIPGAKQINVPECGHTLPLEEPERFINYLWAFTDSVE